GAADSQRGAQSGSGACLSRRHPARSPHRVLHLRERSDPGMAQPETIRLLHITTVPMSLRFLRGQVGYMQARGFTVDALSSPGALLHQFAAEEGTGAHAVEMPRRISPLRDLIAVWRIVQVIRQVRPHIVHAHTPKGGLLGMIAAWLARVPVRV